MSERGNWIWPWWLALVLSATGCTDPDTPGGGGDDDTTAADDDASDDDTGDDDTSAVVPWGAQHASAFDFDGDGATDLAVYHPDGGLWSIRHSSDGAEHALEWGWTEAVPVPGEYDGDGLIDVAVHHQRQGHWYVRQSSDGATMEGDAIGYGWIGTAPVSGDFDGDGLTDLAVYYPQTAEWYVRHSAGGGDGEPRVFGPPNCRPVPGDYDGDGITDFAVFQPVDANWYVERSSDGQMLDGEPFLQFGWSEVVPVPGDYDGDGLTDLAVYHPAGGDWYARRSSDGALLEGGAIHLDPPDLLPVPGDYDGDGVTDLGGYRFDEGDWWIRRSSDGALLGGGGLVWGGDEAVPVGVLHKGILWDAEIDLPSVPDIDGIDSNLEGNSIANLPVSLAYDRDWIIQADVVGFNGAHGGRYLTYDKGSHPDIFPWPYDVLLLRVYNRKIWLRTDPLVGGGHALYPSYKVYDGTYDEEGNPNYTCDETLTEGELCNTDHVGATVEGDYLSGDHSIRLEYLVSRSRSGEPDDGVFRFYWDGALVGDWNLWVEELPEPMQSLWVGRLSGGVLRYYQGRYQTVIGL
jgi:hypothetical protein